MGEWKVVLGGSGFDLETLSSLAVDGMLSIRKVDGKFILESVEFESLDCPDAVWDRAVAIVRTINGAARVLFGDHSNVAVDRIIRDKPDGGTSVHVVVEVPVASARARAGACVVHVDGMEEEDSGCSPLQSWVSLASRDEDAAEVLRYFERDCLTYSDLYKIYEIVKHNCAVAGVSFDRYLSRTRDRALRANLNCTALSGDEARHARYLVPPEGILKMGHGQVVAMVRELVHKWLDDLPIR